ncbi:FkbM family methyltransferase [Paraburkholderia unamae]|uniref:FkbM family methyltransferase n=1 Tax=Paraburkholderia unamae TaxID=219649 RepID=A0ACC6RW11_9BURK
MATMEEQRGAAARAESHIPRMTPFRQIYRAYSTLMGLRGSVEALSQRLDKMAQELAPVAPSIERMSPKIDVIEEKISQKKPVDLYDRHGFTFMLDRSSLVDRTMIETSQWEPGQVELFTRLMEHFRGAQSNVFLDIGSYWGLYSFLAVKSRIFDKIYAFEADPSNFAQLQANVFLNRAANEIKAFNKAVSAKAGFLNVWNSFTHTDGNRAGVGIVSEDFPHPTSRVESVMIDEFLGLKEANLAVKIDVEGHELAVLSGMERTIRDNRVIMQVEIYPEQQAAVFPLLERLGLRRINQIEHDFYYTNINESTLGY